MRPIRKKVITDETMKPVAVQIDYADWLDIERALDLDTANGRAVDLWRFSGAMSLTEDPLAYQKRTRGEWS